MNNVSLGSLGALAFCLAGFFGLLLYVMEKYYSGTLGFCLVHALPSFYFSFKKKKKHPFALSRSRLILAFLWAFLIFFTSKEKSVPTKGNKVHNRTFSAMFIFYVLQQFSFDYLLEERSISFFQNKTYPF